MVEFTFLELHVEDSDLTANAPYSYGEKDVDAGGDPPDDDASGRGRVVAAFVGLCFLVAVAYLVRTRVLGGDEEASEGQL